MLKWLTKLFPRDKFAPQVFVQSVLDEMEALGITSPDGVFLVPNRVTLRVPVQSKRELAKLRASLVPAELVAALALAMETKGYQTEGPLTFTLEDRLDLSPGAKTPSLLLLWPEIPPEDSELPTQHAVAELGVTDDEPLVLVGRVPELPRREVVLGSSPVRLGRKDDNDIVLPEQDISRFHAEVQLIGRVAYVTDLKSSNGIFVNEERIAASVPRPLKVGDVLRLGKSVTFVLESFDTERTRM